MPHTRDGKVVQPGDRVYLPCTVLNVHASEDFCNVDVETEFTMPPYVDAPLRLSAVNTTQFISAEGLAKAVK